MSSPKEKTFKEIHGKTRVGKFLKEKGPALLGTLINVAGDLVPGGSAFKGVVSSLIGNSALSPDDQAHTINLMELDYKDIADARAMQVAALQQDDLFSKRFIYYLAIGVFLFSATIVLLLFWVEVPDKNKDVVNFILGVVVGTGLTGVFQYFFGSSKGSKDKSDFLNR